MKNLLLIAALMLGSCANHNTSVRTEYFLDKNGPFVISNSQTNPYQLKKINGGIQIEYSLIVKNISNKIQEVDLSSSSYKVNSEEGPLKCFINNEESKVTINIESQKQFRVDCNKELFSNQKNELLSKDSTVFLNINFSNSIELSARYSTVIEDFE